MENKELKQEAVKQLEEYMKDDRLGNIEHLKKYVVVFKGFEDYYVEEIQIEKILYFLRNSTCKIVTNMINSKYRNQQKFMHIEN